VCAVLLLLCEWTARGTLAGFAADFFLPHLNAYILAWVFLLLAYYIFDGLFRFAPAAFFLTAILAVVPGIVNFYTLKLRGEPLTTCPIRASVDNYTPLSEHLFEIGVLR
jgi:hypothetical protein